MRAKTIQIIKTIGVALFHSLKVKENRSRYRSILKSAIWINRLIRLIKIAAETNLNRNKCSTSTGVSIDDYPGKLVSRERLLITQIKLTFDTPRDCMSAV